MNEEYARLDIVVIVVGAAPSCDAHDGTVSAGGGGGGTHPRRSRRRGVSSPPTRIRRHERVRGLSACLGAAVPGQRLAGRLGGRRQSESR